MYGMAWKQLLLFKGLKDKGGNAVDTKWLHMMPGHEKVGQTTEGMDEKSQPAAPKEEVSPPTLETVA